MITAAVDLGGTVVKCALFDVSGNELERWQFLLPESRDKLLATLSNQFLKRFAKFQPAEKVVLAVAGFIDQQKGYIYQSPNIPFLNGVYLGQDVEQKLNCPAFLINDANAAAIGAYFLSRNKRTPLIYLTIGTGLGSGVIIANRLFSGEKGLAAELGHFRINPDGRKCGCGGRGCAETEISATALLKNYYEFSQRKLNSVKELAALARKADSAAVNSFKRFSYFLGNFICSLIYAFNPAQIILGGGVSRAADLFLPETIHLVREKVNPAFIKSCLIKAEKSQKSIALIGAANFQKIEAFEEKRS